MLEFGFYNMDCILGMKEFPDNYFDLAIVDPVYGGVSKGGYMTHNKGQKIGTGAGNSKGYHDALWKQEKTDKQYFDELFRVSKNQIVWGGNYFVSSIMKDSQGWIVWDKQHACKRSFADCELAWTSFNRASRIFRFRWDGMLQGDMKNKEKRIHPTQKPIPLYSWILENYSKDGDIILDTHVGSASSLIACHRMRRQYVGFEIDEHYFNLANERMQSEMAQLSILDFLTTKEQPQ